MLLWCATKIPINLLISGKIGLVKNIFHLYICWLNKSSGFFQCCPENETKNSWTNCVYWKIHIGHEIAFWRKNYCHFSGVAFRLCVGLRLRKEKRSKLVIKQWTRKIYERLEKVISYFFCVLLVRSGVFVLLIGFIYHF